MSGSRKFFRPNIAGRNNRFGLSFTVVVDSYCFTTSDGESPIPNDAGIELEGVEAISSQMNSTLVEMTC